MTATIPTRYGDLTYWTTSDPQSLPVASSAMMTSVANALDNILANYTTAALLLADSPTLAGYYTADDAPGGFFFWSGSAWTALVGTPAVTSTGIITSPLVGWQVLVSGITYRYDGSGWKAWESDWITYTPTLTNISLGTGGTATARYQFVNGNLAVVGTVTLGSGFSLSDTAKISLPSGVSIPATTFTKGLVGELSIRDISAPSSTKGIMLQVSGDTTVLSFAYLAASNVETPMSNTNPISLATGDILHFEVLIPMGW